LKASPPESQSQEQPETPEKPAEEEDLGAAFAALKRKRAALREKHAAFQRERGEFEKERASLLEAKTLLERIRSRDESALAETFGEDYLEQLVRSKLDPNRAELDKKIAAELRRRDDELRALRERLDGYERARAEEARREIQSELVRYARSLDAPELDLLEDGEVIDVADRLAAQFAEEAGRSPTFKELTTLIRELQRPRYERVRRRFQPPPAEAPVPPRGGGVKTITSAPHAAGAPEVAQHGGEPPSPPDPFRRDPAWTSAVAELLARAVRGEG
jgi:hypothetical protein